MTKADDTTNGGYVYSKLTAAIDDKQSPLRHYLDTTYPNTRLITTPHSQTSPDIKVPGTPGVNPGTIGTAFDVLIGLRYQPNTIPATARPFARWKPDLAEGWANILNLIAEDPTLIEAAAWAYALAIEAYRSPVTPYAIADLLDEKGRFNEHDLLAIASAEAVAELAALEELAEANLYPHLGTPPEPDPSIEHGWRRAAAWTDPNPTAGDRRRRFGLTFAASRLCQADADLIHDGTLYEFKTRLGTKKKPTGERVDVLPLIDLYQAIAYALFDTNDENGINHIAVYPARYGRHTRWAVEDLLTTLAGRPINIAEERATVWHLLGGKDA
ncbi:hypothetical protein [Nocardioides donggukensis]|uniref:Uncharacterized protein n=1 Tax=Nocardioides donggukensis TaxID=2774019 RepID=A0A927PZQ2_9ACTN|nr:hypothetical protein [Nocardioides donggukensis]MBD8870613.1 hypothetical protein [Nocardioides donggukensis]